MMFRRGLPLCFSLTMASFALADAQITLVPVGPVVGGQNLAVDIMLSQVSESANARLVRMIQVDTTLSNAALGIPNTGPVWNFAGLANCSGAPGTCAGYYFDADLGPTSFGPKTASMAYYFQNEANLGPNAAAQISVPASGSVKVGTLNVAVPVAPGSYLLDVVNAPQTDVNTGSVVYWGFGLDGAVPADPVRIFRPVSASPNKLLGGTLIINVIPDGEAMLTGSVPGSCTTANGSGASLWRSANNVLLADFDIAITAPGAGQVEINELLSAPAGGFGTSLNTATNFTFTVETGPNGPNTRLRIKENGTFLAHRKWFAFRNTGAWAGVADFSIKLVVQVGDATGDGRVVGADASAINACVTCPNVENGCPNAACAAPQNRRDIDGNNRIVGLDVSLANVSITSANVTVPTGHTCP